MILAALFAFLFFVYISSPVFAHECDAVLRDGVLQHTWYQHSDYSRLVLAVRLASMTYDESKSATSAGITLPIDGIPLKASQ
jgi:hypothetical protein